MKISIKQLLTIVAAALLALTIYNAETSDESAALAPAKDDGGVSTQMYVPGGNGGTGGGG